MNQVDIKTFPNTTPIMIYGAFELGTLPESTFMFYF